MADKDQLWVKAVLVVVLVVLSIFGSIIVLEAHQYYVKVPTSGYTESAEYTVKDNLIPNLLYNVSTLEDPNIIYNSITSSINISAQVYIQLNNISKTQVSIISQVTLVSSSPSWEKLINSSITSKNISSEGTIQIPLYLNISKETALANNIDNQLQDGKTDPTVNFNLSIIASGFNLYTTSMSISLHGTYEDLAYGSSSPASVSIYKQELITPHNLIGLGIFYGYILLGAAAATGIAIAVIYAPRIIDPVEKVRKELNEQLIEIDSPPLERASKVKSLEDLVKISEIFESPIFLYAPDKVLYVSHLSEQYKFELL